MPDVDHRTAESFVGSWVLLFPATYLAHIVEEYWGGFPARMAEVTGFAVPKGAFLGANAVFWVLMVGVAVLVLRRSTRALLVVALATIVTINAALHCGGALLTLSYSPGLLSGVLLWLPLGVGVLVRGRRFLPRRDFRAGVLIGIAAHVLVPVVGIGLIVAFGGGGPAA